MALLGKVFGVAIGVFFLLDSIALPKSSMSLKVPAIPKYWFQLIMLALVGASAFRIAMMLMTSGAANESSLPSILRRTLGPNRFTMAIGLVAFGAQIGSIAALVRANTFEAAMRKSQPIVAALILSSAATGLCVAFSGR